MTQRIRRQIPAVKPQLGGVVQSFTFAVNQPPAQPRQDRAQPFQANPAVHPTSAATVQQTYVFPVNQPRNSRTYRVRTGALSIKGDVPRTFFTLDLPVFPISEPDVWRTQLVNSVRSRQDVVAQIHQGTVPSLSFDIYALSQPGVQYYIRPTPVSPILPFEGAPAAPAQTQIFKLSDVVPQGHYGYRPAPKLIVRVITGAATVAPVITVLPVSPQPDSIWWSQVDRLRQRKAFDPQFTGATQQQTYVFPLGQPTSQFYVPRTQPVQAVRPEGQPLQGLFLFYSTQPDRAGWYVDRRATQNPWTDKQFPASETPPVAPQTYIFDLSQLTQPQHSLARIQRAPDLNPKQINQPVIITWQPYHAGIDNRFQALTINTQPPIQNWIFEVVPIIFQVAWALNANQSIGLNIESDQ